MTTEPSPSIMTVLGPITPESLGLADAHSHVWIDQVEGSCAKAPVLTDERLLSTRLSTYVESGGKAIIDCQPSACGRNAIKLFELSKSSGVHIVACTGFHLHRYYDLDAAIWDMTAEQANDYFLSEIEQGLAETRQGPQVVYPGFIKIAVEAEFEPSLVPLFEAAAEACRTSGLAIEMHTEKGAAVEALLPFFLDRGVSPQRLVFCHVDKRPDFELHRELAQAGVMLEYDTFFRPKYHPDQNVWPLLMRMLEAGYGDHIALASDMAELNMWREPGPAGFAVTLGRRLKEMRTDDSTITALMGANIATRLAA
ncbi:MAG: hypothetical protein GY759_18555 [Chloroflexi bacterium]|nr:hypothetical protein [Chloroflexota bacterium]